MVPELGLSSVTAEGLGLTLGQETKIPQAMAWEPKTKKQVRTQSTEAQVTGQVNGHWILAGVEEVSGQTHPRFPLSATAHPT